MITSLLALFAAWAVSVIAPGPDFIAVLRNSAVGGRRQGVMISLGVVSGIACWATLALVGLSALLARYEHLYLVIRFVGAAFLFAYGVRVAWHAVRGQATESTKDSTHLRSSFSAWRLGLITNLANPKAVVFFGALFATLLPRDMPAIGRVGVLVVMLLMAIAWFVFVTFIASSGPFVVMYRRAERRVEAVLGVAFAGLGLALVAEH